MKHNILKSLLLFLFVCFSNTINAYDFAVDGIYYNITDEINLTVEVTYSGVNSSQNPNRYSGEVIIPSEVNYNNKIYNVTGIRDQAFYGCYNTTSVIIPNSIINIGSYVFCGCTKLTSFIIGDNVEKINSGTFYGCSQLINVHIGKNVTSIGTSAFQDCNSLTSIVIPSNVVSIENNVFTGCVNIKEVVFEDGESPLALGDYVYANEYYISKYGLFYNCNKLEKLYIGRNILYNTSNNISPFSNKNKLNSVIFGKDVTNIGERMLYGCSAITDVYFYSNPTIGTNAIPSTAKCQLMLDDSNATDFNNANSNTYTNVSYTRTISEGKYGTIILPFAPDAASLENYVFYELIESGEGYMRFEEVATPIANTPYIYTLREGKENVAITGGETTISSNIETPTIVGWRTIGSFKNQSIDTEWGYYYALSTTSNEINRITKSLKVLPYRAYYQSANASKSALNIYINGTTGIIELSLSEIDGFENEAIFDLSGRKVSEPIKGNIYIKDGKKIMF